MDAAYRESCAKHNRKDTTRCFLLGSIILFFSLVLIKVEPTLGHFQSNDNILRIQLWDGDALSRSARLSDDTTDGIVESSQVIMDRISLKPVHVKVDDLMGEMFNTHYESQLTSRDIKNRRYRRHRKHNRNKRKRKNRNNTEVTNYLLFKRKRNIAEHSSFEKSVPTKPLAWRFHDKHKSINVLTYESTNEIGAPKGHSSASANMGEESEQSSAQNKTERSVIVNANSVPTGEVGAPPWGNSPNNNNSTNSVDSDINNSSIYKVLYDKTNDSISKVNQQFDIAVGEDKTASDVQDIQPSKRVAIVRKCCDIGQNITAHATNGTRACAPTLLTFHPIFYEMYDSSHFTNYTGNLFETIVGYPCQNSSRYKLDPEANSIDEFYLLTNGSIFAPFRTPQSLGPNDFCMETFWNGTNDAGLTLPLVCFDADGTEEAGSSATLVIYAIGLLISVPFLLTTTLVYALTPELREAHGLALASHCGCLAVAFTCLAATQLAGHAFPEKICTMIAYVIQFSFVACFFWLNVMCHNTWLNVRHYLSGATSRGRERRRFALYSVYAWLLPLALLLVSLVMDFSPAVPSTYVKPDFGVVGCWFKSDQGALPYFYAPVGCILFANFVIFILTSRAFAKQLPRLERLSIAELTHPELMAADADDSLRLSGPTSASDTTSSPSDESPVTNKFNNFKHRWKKYKRIFRMCCLLSILLGLSCVMELVSWLAGSGGSGSWSVFDVLNALQGVVVFSIFVAMKPYREIIWRRLRRKYFCLRHEPNVSTETMSEHTIIRTDLKRERVYV